MNSSSIYFRKATEASHLSSIAFKIMILGRRQVVFFKAIVFMTAPLSFLKAPQLLFESTAVHRPEGFGHP